MEHRLKKVYDYLYKKPCSKEFFAETFDLSTKTIENTIKNSQEDIIYDKKISAYRFNNVLPKYISYESFFKLFKSSIGNNVIRNDFIDIGQNFKLEDDNFLMINTSTLSDLAQKIISCDVAINHNSVLEIDYLGNAKAKAKKYIQPHTIISTGFTYYLLATYDERNVENVGEERSFGFNGISDIQSIEYIKNGKFRIDGEGNAYGRYSKDQYVTLKLQAYCAMFFKKEGLFKKGNFEFLSEDADGSIFVNMYYNQLQEIISLIQQWMPQISIQKNLELKQEIYSKIKSNVDSLLNS